jgi:L-alanine-DL-glutamate epimerase-like enolase superfamily enzyme
METLNFGIELVEQPVPAHDWEGLKFVTERVNVPIMADESLFSSKDALRLVSGRYVDLLNIKLMKCGGINEARKIASIAEANGVACMIGSMMEPSLSVGAAAHLAAAHPNITYFDLDAPLWLSTELDVLKYSGQEVFLSDLPGIGEITVPISK